MTLSKAHTFAKAADSLAVLGFSFFGGGTGVATLSSGGHTTNTFELNYWVCNRLYQIINTSKFTSQYVM